MDDTADILILGFSVTADTDGYAPQLRAMLAERLGLRADVIGIGGIQPVDLLYLYNRVVAKSYAMVLLDITTSSFRQNQTNPDILAFPLFAIAQKVLQAGSQPVFLNLWRNDFNPSDDLAITLVENFARKQRIPCFNLARMIQSELDAGRDLFRDSVHPNAAGSAFYTNKIYDLVAPLLIRPVTPPAGDPDVANVCYAREFDSIFPGMPQRSFERAGLKLRVSDLGTTVAAQSAAPMPDPLVGLACLAGPRTGGLRILSDNGQKAEVNAYDQWCYYERLVVLWTRPGLSGCITLEVDHRLPQITLNKGEPNRETRRGRLSHLLFERQPLPTLYPRHRARWLRH